jgi:lipoate-protein ligase A
MDSGRDLRWRLIVDAPRRGSRNMALDHALATALPAGEAVLRIYGWERPTVSFGKNEPAVDVYDEAAGAARGFAFVRRPTGGAAVLHDAEVTYAVVMPVRAFQGPRRAYLRINEGLVEGLRSLGLHVSVAASGPAPAPQDGPCFGMPAPGEVVAGAGKLVGSAQARVGDVLLQHGSVLLAGDQSALYELRGARPDPAPPATLERLGVRAGHDAVAAALAAGVRLALGGSWDEGVYRTPELDEADRLEWVRYASREWTWRR